LKKTHYSDSGKLMYSILPGICPLTFACRPLYTKQGPRNVAAIYQW